MPPGGNHGPHGSAALSFAGPPSFGVTDRHGVKWYVCTRAKQCALVRLKRVFRSLHVEFYRLNLGSGRPPAKRMIWLQGTFRAQAAF
jgi:hypothetical protein